MTHKRLSNQRLPDRHRSSKADLSVLSRHAAGGIVGVEEAAKLLSLDRKTAAVRLAALARRGWLTRVRRGIYYVLPLESGAEENAVAPDPWVLAFRLFSPCYIGGWSAAEHWGLTEQLFRSTFIVTAATVRERSPRVLGTEFHLVRLRPDRLSSTASVWRGSVRVPVSDRERTIADALVDPSWVGGLRHLTDLLATYAREDRPNLPKILEHLERLKRASGIKRFGFLLECLFPKETDLISAAHALRSTGAIRLDPAIKDRGRLSKRWGLWVNTSIVPSDET
jgi:predicted transcriptional regulator of viral defense system